MLKHVNYAGLVALALVWCNTSSAAQATTVPTRTLAQPEVELSEPFTRLMGVRELADGRLIVSDITEKFIAIVDLAKRTSTRIGSVGQGPGEYTLPGAVLAFPGDTTLVSDMMGRKFLKIAPTGTFAGDVTLSPTGGMPGPGGGRGMMMVGGSTSADANGRIYSLGPSFKLSPDGQMTPTDSAPITRADIRSGRTDTVSFIKVPQAQVQSTGTPGNQNVRVSIGGPSIPFLVQQAWTAAPDGRVAVVTPEPYRVTWISPTGQKTTGQPIPFERIRVTEAEKTAHRESMKSSPATAVTMRSDGPGTNQVVTQGPATFREPDSWPEYKHPFSPGTGSVMVAPSGELWVSKQLSATQRNPTFDIIGARGELTGRIVIPTRTRLLGFGRNGAVYLVRRDADDLEYIQRHRLTQGR